MTTISSIFWSRLPERANRTGLLIKSGDEFQPRPWAEIGEDVRRLAVALRSTGIELGDRVVQISENRYEWLIADLAIHSIGAIHVPVHASLSGHQIAYQIQHCQPRFVLVSTAEQALKLADFADDVPPFTPVIYEPDAGAVAGRSPLLLADLMKSAGMKPLQPWQAASHDVATILYTSGTTGEPKGVMLTHENLVSNALGVLEMIPAKSDDVRLNFLPLSHIFARTCDAYTWITGGSVLALAESRTTVIEDCAAVRPTLLNGVPYFYERIAKLVGELQPAEQPARLKALFGGRLRFCCSGGAALPNYVYDFFFERGLPVYQGYGLTESSPVITVSSPEQHRRGAVGRTIPGVEVRIADDGEILTRGPHVMLGYYRDPRSTELVLRDGWLHTGDIGRLDNDGYLFITGRKKEILVTSGGKNIAPVLLETMLMEDSLIQQAMVVGDGRKCLAALIVPDVPALTAELERRDITLASPGALTTDPAVRAIYSEVIARRMASLSHYEQIAFFSLLKRPFSIEEGEMTAKLSLRREVIQQHFASEIEAMYQHEHLIC